MQQRPSVRSARAFIGRFFKSRNIIVISEHKVGHYSVGTGTQLLLATAIAGFICWASYATGSYMAAKNALREKDQKILVVNLERKKMGEDVSLLKQDLMTHKEKTGLSESSRSILAHYPDNPTEVGAFFSITPEQLGALEPAAGSRDNTNVAALRQQLKKMEMENRLLVSTIRSKTQGKIRDLEEVITMTGLNAEKLQQAMVEEAKKSGKAGSEKLTFFGSQGGPYLPSSATQALMEKESALFDDVNKMVDLHEVVSRLPISKPISGSQFMSPFGTRVDPFTKRLATHTGLDLAGPASAKILCTSAGKVKFTGRRGSYGNMVEIDHGFGISTVYAHLSQINVTEGQGVTRGQVVGIQGSTGRSTGPHLHYEVRINNRPVNPKKFIEAGTNVL